MRRIAGWLALGLLALAAATYVAGEQTEVVVLRTVDAQGEAFETKMWVVDHDGEVFVRVANPRRHWYQRLLANPRAELVRDGQSTRVAAEPSEDPETLANRAGGFGPWAYVRPDRPAGDSLYVAGGEVRLVGPAYLYYSAPVRAPEGPAAGEPVASLPGAEVLAALGE